MWNFGKNWSTATSFTFSSSLSLFVLSLYSSVFTTFYSIFASLSLPCLFSRDGCDHFEWYIFASLFLSFLYPPPRISQTSSPSKIDGIRETWKNSWLEFKDSQQTLNQMNESENPSAYRALRSEVEKNRESFRKALEEYALYGNHTVSFSLFGWFSSFLLFLFSLLVLSFFVVSRSGCFFSLDFNGTWRSSLMRLIPQGVKFIGRPFNFTQSDSKMIRKVSNSL